MSTEGNGNGHSWDINADLTELRVKVAAIEAAVQERSRVGDERTAHVASISNTMNTRFQAISNLTHAQAARILHLQYQMGSMQARLTDLMTRLSTIEKGGHWKVRPEVLVPLVGLIAALILKIPLKEIMPLLVPGNGAH